jgi:histidine triad (HIT) family protein
MEDCIFCKIVAGDIPSHKVYEDDNVLAFLDIHPIQSGHTLVVPKNHEPHFDQLTGSDYTATMDVVKRLAFRQKQQIGRERACVRIEGFDVPHAHVHVYPADSPEEFYGDKNRAEAEPDHEALSKIAEKLYFE